MLCLATDTTPTISAILFVLLGGLLTWAGQLITQRVSRTDEFDKRMRLDKEYALYGDVWEKLFNLRRAMGEYADLSFQNSDSTGNAHTKFADVLVEYEDSITHNEPFIHSSVLPLAQQVLDDVRQILFNERRNNRLDKQSAFACKHGETVEQGELRDQKQENLETETQHLLDNIRAGIKMISAAMRDRVGPP